MNAEDAILDAWGHHEAERLSLGEIVSAGRRDAAASSAMRAIRAALADGTVSPADLGMRPVDSNDPAWASAWEVPS